MLRFPRVTVVLTAGLLFVAACGGSSSPKPAAQTGGNNTSSSSSSSSSSSDGGGGGAVPGDIVAGSYQRGSAHVDISGGTSTSADLNKASGVSGAGVASVNFNDGGTNTLTLVLGTTDEEKGVAISVNGITTGGQFGDKCTIDVNKNDGSELSGSFTCTGVDGVGASGEFTGSLNIKGTFSAKA